MSSSAPLVNRTSCRLCLVRLRRRIGIREMLIRPSDVKRTANRDAIKTGRSNALVGGNGRFETVGFPAATQRYLPVLFRRWHRSRVNSCPSPVDYFCRLQRVERFPIADIYLWFHSRTMRPLTTVAQSGNAENVQEHSPLRIATSLPARRPGIP